MYEYVLHIFSSEELLIGRDNTFFATSANSGVWDPYVNHQAIGLIEVASSLAVIDPNIPSRARKADICWRKSLQLVSFSPIL